MGLCVFQCVHPQHRTAYYPCQHQCGTFLLRGSTKVHIVQLAAELELFLFW